MSFESFQSVIGNAVIDTEFRKGLLNGKRRFILADFSLSPDEVEFAMKIRANSLEDFAGQLDSWISHEQGNVDLPALPAKMIRTKYSTPSSFQR